MPLNLPLFERLGIDDEVERITIRKYGAEVVSLWHGKSVTFDFAVAWDKSLPNAYQVRRSEFDHILSKNAIDTGASFI